MIKDMRVLAMLDWLQHDLLLTIIRFSPASSDASFRRYFRIETPDGSLIVMDAPPEKENVRSFIKVNQLLFDAGVNVPEIFAANPDDGFLLLEDFGGTDFLDCVNADNAGSLYQLALDELFCLQSKTTSGVDGILPDYDRALLTRELGIFDEWYLGRHLDVEMPTDLRQTVYEMLITAALEQPRSFVHRDYHSRNLMVLANGSLGVLDFQDAVVGPVTYDLVSLLRDCYVDWPDRQVENWLNHYYLRLHDAHFIDCSFGQFKRWFDWMGMQRHLKAIGIFARLNWRDGKPGYLKHIPRTLNYVLAQADFYPEFSGFANFLRASILPNLSVTA